MLNNPIVIQVVMKEQHQDRLKEVEHWRLCREIRRGQAGEMRLAGPRLWLVGRGWFARVWVNLKPVLNSKDRVKRRVLP